MVYEIVDGIYKKVNGIYRNVQGIREEVNKRYENVNGINKKVYHPWVLVKDGKLINEFHFAFINTYNPTIIDLKDYTNLYEDENGVWIELKKPYAYSGYMPRTTHLTRFLMCLNIAGCQEEFLVGGYKMRSTYRSVNYRCSMSDTLWGMFPFSAGGGREDYHLNTTAVSGTWTTLADNQNNENAIINGKYYPTMVGMQAINAGTRTITYNSIKICIRDFYAYDGEM